VQSAIQDLKGNP